MAGPLVSYAVMMWIGIGKYTVIGVKEHLPFPTQNCPSDLNLTTSATLAVTLAYPGIHNFSVPHINQSVMFSNISAAMTTHIPVEGEEE
jgi:hypothetical protein